ncbi:MAG TPA: hypothetical protein VFP93_03850, partial [Gammaproteobacteria bacterium]|nr:hypothetical protein [Gammaproteobacteria bacterium]
MTKVITKQDILDLENDLRAEMIKKLNPSEKWNYCTFLPGDNQQAIKDQMLKFLNNDLGSFLQASSDILVNFTQADADSIGSGKETSNALKFIDLMKGLEKSGFNGTRNMPINFWSGNIGRTRAHLNPQQEFSDSEVTSLVVLFDLCGLIQKFESKSAQQDPNFKKTLSSLLPEALSKLYANEARGNVNVYMASDKLSELSGLTAGNNFWNAELPTLQSLLHLGKVKAILVHTYDHATKSWKSPVNINDREADVINIVRRCSHPGSGKLPADTDPQLFVQDRSQKEYEVWCNTASARSLIQLGKLRKFTSK